MIWIKKKSKKILDRKIALKQMVKLFFAFLEIRHNFTFFTYFDIFVEE